MTTTSAFVAVAAHRERQRRGRLDRIGRRRLGLVDRPALENRVEKPVAEVVLGLVREGRALALARIPDPLADLEVHVVAARRDLGESREPVRILSVQPAHLRFGITPSGLLQEGGERRHEVRTRGQRPVEPLLRGPRLAGRRHGVRCRDEDVGQRPERRAVLRRERLLAGGGHGSLLARDSRDARALGYKCPAMGIVLGLTAALSWGLADYFAAMASRRAGSFRVVLGFHLVAVALLALLLVRTGETLSDRQRRRPGLVRVPGRPGRALLSLLLPSARNRPDLDREPDRLCLCGGHRCLCCRHRRRAARSGRGTRDRGRVLRRAARVLRPRPVQGPRTDCAPRDPPGPRHRGRDRRVRLRDRLLQCDLRVARPDLPRPGVFDALPSRRFASRGRMALSRPLAAASGHDFADRGRRHSRIRRLQLRGPARGYDRRRDRRGAVLGRSDRVRRRAPARAPALGAMGRNRRS